ETKGKNKTDLPTQLKVANRSIFVAETLSRGCGNRRGSEASPSGGPGAQPRHAFGSFRRETKGTPGVGRVGPPMGERRGGPKAAPRREAIVKEKTFFQKFFQKLHVCVQLSPSSGVRVKGVVLN